MQEQTATPRTSGRRLRDLLETVLVAVGIYLVIQFVIPPYSVDGASMDPNLHDGEHLLVNRPVYAHIDATKLLNLLPWVERDGAWIVYPFHAPEQGEIVVFDPPVASDESYIKRVIGVPGDKIAFADGHVLINGERLAESYLDGPITFCDGGPHCRVTVPDGAVYLLGDNRDNSTDSRDFGPVSVDAIIGKAWFANWPIEDIGFIE